MLLYYYVSSSPLRSVFFVFILKSFFKQSSPGSIRRFLTVPIETKGSGGRDPNRLGRVETIEHPRVQVEPYYDGIPALRGRNTSIDGLSSRNGGVKPTDEVWLAIPSPLSGRYRQRSRRSR